MGEAYGAKQLLADPLTLIPAPYGVDRAGDLGSSGAPITSPSALAIGSGTGFEMPNLGSVIGPGARYHLRLSGGFLGTRFRGALQGRRRLLVSSPVHIACLLNELPAYNGKPLG